MILDFKFSDSTGRFVVTNGGGRMLFETYHLTGVERANLRELIEQIRDQAFQEGLAVGNERLKRESFDPAD